MCGIFMQTHTLVCLCKYAYVYSLNTYVISTLHMKNVHTMTPLLHKNGDAHICVMMEVGIFHTNQHIGGFA